MFSFLTQRLAEGWYFDTLPRMLLQWIAYSLGHGIYQALPF